MSKATDQLQWTQETGETIVLKGVVDERAPAVLAEVKAIVGPKVVFDFGGVRRINSLGVRAWIQLMKSLVGREIVLRRCTPAIVEQLNALRDFGGQARVESVLAPYLCERCGEVRFEDVLIGGELKAGKSVDQAPPRSCKSCNSPMQFDDLPERYFQFLMYHGAAR